MNSGVLVSVIDGNNAIHKQQRIVCGGERLLAYVALPHIEPDWQQCYLICQYYMENKELLPSTWQLRIEQPRAAYFPTNWLRVGLGISSEMLLQLYAME